MPTTYIFCILCAQNTPPSKANCVPKLTPPLFVRETCLNKEIENWRPPVLIFLKMVQKMCVEKEKEPKNGLKSVSKKEKSQKNCSKKCVEKK